MRTSVHRLALALRIILGSASFAGALTTLTLVNSSAAQSDVAAAVSEPVDPPSTAQSGEPAGADEDFAPNVNGSADDGLLPDMDLESGLPLKYLMTPFHWGRLSLLSFTAYESYNSNPDFTQAPVGAYVTSVSALLLYSAKFQGWKMNLQYRPFAWISSTQTFKDFSAVSLDLRTAQHINDSWRWTVDERFRYSPAHSTDESVGYVGAPGFSFGNPFLSVGRNVLANETTETLTDRYSENSYLTFHSNQTFTRLSTDTAQSADIFPAQEAIAVSAGATWHDHFTPKQGLTLGYVYGLQTASGAAVAVNSQTAIAGWSYQLQPSLAVSASFGPSWSIYSADRNSNMFSRGRVRLQGSLALAKQFRRGSAILAFARSDEFNGVISDSLSNRYDATAHLDISTRLSCSATASYVQQQLFRASNTNGKLASAEVRYLLSPDWSVFGEVRYLHITGNQEFIAPEKSAIVGFHWSWVPQKP